MINLNQVRQNLIEDELTNLGWQLTDTEVNGFRVWQQNNVTMWATWQGWQASIGDDTFQFPPHFTKSEITQMLLEE